MRDGDEDDKVSKAEFVWLMVRLAETDREKYRELRAMGWDFVEQNGPVPQKSELPN